MTYSLISAPSRTSIFNKGGSMFSPGLIKDTVCMHNLCTHGTRAHVCNCLFSHPVVGVKPAVGRQEDTGSLIVLENLTLDPNFWGGALSTQQPKMHGWLPSPPKSKTGYKLLSTADPMLGFA